MLKSLISILKNRSKSTVLQKLLQMAENAETVNVGDKRAAVSPTNQKAKKKKKDHVVTLGKDEGYKRKVALLVAYNGAGYYGVQVNRGFKTIESELFSALVKAGTVPQDHVDNLPKMWFQRGSRTDKGVSAVGQIFSLKMVIVPDLVSKLNENLPEQIRAIGYKRTTNGFDSKNFCCGRTYMYMMPTFAFAPIEKFITDDYRMTNDSLEHAREILKQYVGTHKFHNFTSGVKYEQANASRYIISFECSDPYIREGIEFVTLRIRGQSFMLHQIRKMIGLTIAIVRGYCTETALTKSWDAERIDIPKAPGLGLVLEALHFDGYNKKFGRDGVHNPIDWSEQQEVMDDFKEKHIISYIVQQEKTERVMLNWLQTLQFHNFDVTRSEGPQKPWVKTTKLLLDKSKDTEAGSGPETDNSKEGVVNVTNDEPTKGEEATESKPDSTKDDTIQPPENTSKEDVTSDGTPKEEGASLQNVPSEVTMEIASNVTSDETSKEGASLQNVQSEVTMENKVDSAPESSEVLRSDETTQKEASLKNLQEKNS